MRKVITQAEYEAIESLHFAEDISHKGIFYDANISDVTDKVTGERQILICSAPNIPSIEKFQKSDGSVVYYKF